MVSPLDRKLLRDIGRMKGQSAAIAVVIALGVLMLVMMQGLVVTLETTRQAYYDRYRFADMFAPAVRAPMHVLEQIAAIEGVNAVEGRINQTAQINLPDIALPIQAQALSLPDHGQPRLNNVYLIDGHLPATDRDDQVLLLNGFAAARDLRPGDTLSTTILGARRSFVIAGIAEAPEFLYTSPPGEMVPDDARFAVIWLPQRTLSAISDLQGAFNEALLDLDPGADTRPIIQQVDHILSTYGGIGAYGNEDHMSNRFVSEEISGVRASSTGIPPIFLGVAAFLLYIVISRMVQAEREEIGLLKAFGYTSLEVATHYLKFVLLIAVAGAVLGSLLGISFGHAMAVYYQVYFKFPFLVFQVEPRSFIVGFIVSVLAASAGGLFVLRRIFNLTPAVAMRPPAPADYSKSWDISGSLRRFLDQPTRMVLRRLLRHPWRMGGAVIGIATGMALSASMISLMVAFDETLDVSFAVVDRSDMTVSFARPASGKAIFELGRIDGVLNVEPVRIVPAIFRNGVYEYRGSVDGLGSLPELHRVLDNNQQPIDIPPAGIILARSLADVLHISPGEVLSIEVRDGQQTMLDVPVTGIAQTLMGAPAFMDIDALNRALREPGRISAAYLRIDPAKRKHIYNQLRGIPGIGGVSVKQESREAFQKIMDTGSGALRYVMTLIAAIITFGIVYNSARIAYAERSRDLASLRVLGFSLNEAGFVLLGELAIVVLIALPLGALMGHGLNYLVAAAFSTDLYQIPVVFVPSGHGLAAAAVVVASVLSGWIVRRDLAKSDFVSALKTRE